MRKHCFQCLYILLCLFSLTAQAANEFTAITYHDIQDDPANNRVADAMTISTAELISQLSWLREHGYHPISIDDLLAARKSSRPLPEKAILLTFDDGYLSTYTRVFPLLKLFNFPAVVAPLTKWIEARDKTISYGNKRALRSQFMTWQQLQEMAASGLVEIASHSHNLHHGIVGNPQGNLQPAVVTRQFKRDLSRYENEHEWRQRIASDLRRSRHLIEQHTGKSPRVMVWPYGRYNSQAIRIARNLGMPITFTLDNGTNTLQQLHAVKRILMGNGSTLSDLVNALYHPPETGAVRVVHVDLDYVYDSDPKQQEKNLGLLLDRIKELKINTVYLQAYADPDGDGNADALYFPNRHLPMRADLFNRAAWQLFTRANVSVYAWLPVFSFVLDKDSPAARLIVEREAAGNALAGNNYQRLSPFSPLTRKIVSEIYEDLAIHASFSGLLFHDDAYLSDFEDASSTAMRIYQDFWHLPGSLQQIRSKPVLFSQWTNDKIRTLTNWTQTLTERVRAFRPNIKTARNMYAEVALNPASETWFSQSLDNFLANYDYTAILAMPFLEKAIEPQRWLKKLVTSVARKPGALKRTVFELQSIDWQSKQPVANNVLRQQMELLLTLDVENFGYYPDDFLKAHPDISVIKPLMSLNSGP